MTNKPMLSVELLACPFCGSPASLEDQRLVWCVRCTKCSACVLGDRAPEPHGDGVSSDEVQDAQAAAMSENTDWAAYEKSAVDAWNLRSELGTKKQGDPAAYEACGELFKTIMGARNYAGSMPIFPLFKSAPVGIDMLAACEELRKALRSREVLIDELRALIDKEVDGNSHAPARHGDPVAICRLWNEGGSGERTSVEFLGEPCADGTLLYTGPPAIKLHLNVSNVEVTANADGSYTIDPGEQPPVGQSNSDTVVCRRYTLEQSPGQNFYHYDKEPVYGSVPVTLSELISMAEAAPVAVVMPQFDMQMVMMCLGGVRGAVLTSNQCHALAQMLNACSAEVARLNGVKP